MKFVRAPFVRALGCFLLVGCSQGGHGSFEEADASADTPFSEAASTSPAARAVVARLDARLASVAKLPELPADPAHAPTDISHPPSAPSVRIARDESSLYVRPEASLRSRLAELRLPLDARGAFHIADESGLEADVALRDTNEAAAEVVDGHVVYRKAAARGTADLVHRPSAEGTEDIVLFDERPESENLSYLLSLGSEVAGLRLVENTLELVDDAGAPRLRVAPPYVIDAEGQRHEARLSVEGCAVDTDPVAPWGRLPTPPGASECTVNVEWSGRDVRYPAVVDPSWTTTQSMGAARYNHVAVLLANGKVLVAGGYDGSSFWSSAELYDPSTKTWASTGSMTSVRTRHVAVRLNNGQVLVAGGYSFSSSASYLTSANLYNPATGTWSSTGALNTGRHQHDATLLPDGNVLVAGGANGSGALASAEIYDVAAGSFQSIGNMGETRDSICVVPLSNGKVLIAGGYEESPEAWRTSAELYDPVQKSFTAAGSMSTKRAGHVGPSSRMGVWSSPEATAERTTRRPPTSTILRRTPGRRGPRSSAAAEGR